MAKAKKRGPGRPRKAQGPGRPRIHKAKKKSKLKPKGRRGRPPVSESKKQMAQMIDFLRRVQKALNKMDL